MLRRYKNSFCLEEFTNFNELISINFTFSFQNGESSDSEEEELPPEETFSCLKLLVEHNAQVNAKDTMGLTPLHHACTRGNSKAVKELIQCVGIGLEV